MRALFVRLHRWLGVATALFLFVTGLTGAVIAWDHELDALLNPSFFYAQTSGPALSALELAQRVEAADPRLDVTYLPLGVEPGRTLQMMVMPRISPLTGQPYELGFNQLAVDPVTGAIQGRREWGALSLARLNLLPFIYKLHYSLHLPAVGGFEVGMWLLGIVGIAWLVDSVIALLLSFPSVKVWRKSFAFRLKRGGYALTFDLHRSGGVWIWGLLVLVALTSVSMNLAEPVVRPVVAAFSPLAPLPLKQPELSRAGEPGSMPLTRAEIVQRATQAGEAHHLKAPPGALYYMPWSGAYGIGFFAPGNDHGDVGLGNAWLYYNGHTGTLTGQTIPGEGSAGDVFMQAQFPLHSGRIIGIPGRILMSVIGLAVAMLSVTGLMIWFKKLRARRAVAARSRLEQSAAVSGSM